MAIQKKTGFTGAIDKGTRSVRNLILGGKEVPAMCTFAFSLSGTQYGFDVEVSVCNKDGYLIPGVHVLDVYLSDNADGTTLATNGPAGAITAATGAILGTLTASKAFRVITAITGKVKLDVIDDVTPVLLYVTASLPATGLVSVSRKTVAGDYKP